MYEIIKLEVFPKQLFLNGAFVSKNFKNLITAVIRIQMKMKFKIKIAEHLKEIEFVSTRKYMQVG